MQMCGVQFGFGILVEEQLERRGRGRSVISCTKQGI